MVPDYYRPSLFCAGVVNIELEYICIYIFNFYFHFILLYNTVLVLPYIDINQPWIELGSCQHIRAQKFELDVTYREVRKNGEGRR